MGPLDLNYAALLASILNTKLSCDKALKYMGLTSEKKQIKKDIKSNIEIAEKLNDSLAPEISTLYKNGENTVTLGKKYGVSQVAMYRYFKKNKIETRKRGGSIKRNNLHGGIHTNGSKKNV